MRFRIWFVLFVLAFVSLPVRNSDATTVTRNFSFVIDCITPDGFYYKVSGECDDSGMEWYVPEAEQNEKEKDDDGDKDDDDDEKEKERNYWQVNDRFELSFEYDTEKVQTNYFYPFFVEAKIDSELSRFDFYFDEIDIPKAWYMISQIDDEEVSYKKYGGEYEHFSLFTKASVNASRGYAVWDGQYTFNKDSKKPLSVFFHTAPVPEPSTFLLLGTGLAGLLAYRRKRKH